MKNFIEETTEQEADPVHLNEEVEAEIESELNTTSSLVGLEDSEDEDEDENS